VTEHCAQCLTVVEEHLGYETPRGEILCGPCYFALWGPNGHRALPKPTEEHRPVSLRPRRGRTIWIPGPTGELDPPAGVRRVRRSRER
jgi:hypothetical protein